MFCVAAAFLRWGYVFLYGMLVGLVDQFPVFEKERVNISFGGAAWDELIRRLDSSYCFLGVGEAIFRWFFCLRW